MLKSKKQKCKDVGKAELQSKYDEAVMEGDRDKIKKALDTADKDGCALRKSVSITSKYA